MSTRAVLVIISLFFVPAVASFTQSGVYFAFSGGGGLVHSITDESDTPDSDLLKIAAVAYGSVGYDFGSVRTDAEFGIQSYLASTSIGEQGDTENASVTGLSMMANAWYDFDSVVFLYPYVGIGAGATYMSIVEYDDDSNGWGFAYQAGVGVAVPVTIRWPVYFSIGYRLFGILETEITGSVHGKRSVAPTILHCIEFGLRYGF